MSKTQRELAFLRDLYITDNYTSRFTELADKHFSLDAADNLAYLNAGTGSHCFALREAIDDKIEIFGICEDIDLLSIARDKAIAVKADVDFSMTRLTDDAFDAVIGDASLTDPADLDEFVASAVRVAHPGACVYIMVPTAGSFGEIFSLLWEVLIGEDLGEHGAAAERMISELPTTSRLEEIAEEKGLVNVETHIANEMFDYEDGTAFISSPLVTDFLLPRWLESLTENEKEQVSEKLAQLIDAEDGSMSFRFTVKATLLKGKKAFAH